MSLCSSIEDDADYEDWKQIDGIFASMGVNGKLTESSFLEFLQKDRNKKQDSMKSWLADLRLDQYENVLVVNGFDNIDMLNGLLDRDDLELMGFTNQDHIDTLLTEISSLHTVSPLRLDNIPETIDEWLRSLRLEQYYDNFVSRGFTTMSRVLQLWEVEIVSVLSVNLIGHQKRILLSLSECCKDRFQTKNNRTVFDISHVVKVHDVRVTGEDDIYFKHNFQTLRSKQSTPSPSAKKSPKSSDSQRRAGNDNASLERSDSGCSISSGGAARPEIPERNYSPEDILSPQLPPPIPIKTIAKNSTTLPKKSSAPNSHHIEQLEANKTGQYYNTIAGHGRSQPHSSTTHSASSQYLTLGTGRSTRAPVIAQWSENDLYSTADYANMTSSSQALIANVDGLKLSQATSRTGRVLNRIRRPLPDLPVGEALTFSTSDLPPDFKGIHKPEILIDGCVNYRSCYLGTCLVSNVSSPESSRQAVAKMKAATETLNKLPVVALSISFKGVSFIDAKSKRAICDHEITNIYCAAQDSVLMNYFAYITKDVLTRGLYCHVFCVKAEEMAREVIMTLGEAFTIAYYAMQKHPSLLNPDE